MSTDTPAPLPAELSKKHDALKAQLEQCRDRLLEILSNGGE